MKRKQLSKSEIRELNEKVKAFGIELSKKDKVELIDDNIVLANEKPFFFYHEGRLVPHLKLLLENMCLPKVTVDMGAVKFVVNGADVMRPGITKIDENINKDNLVAVVDEKHGKPLSVCIAMFDGPEMSSMDSGKVLRNIHFVGDELWDA